VVFPLTAGTGTFISSKSRAMMSWNTAIPKELVRSAALPPRSQSKIALPPLTGGKSNLGT